MKLKDHVKQMKKLADVLQCYTSPRHPHDDDISWLKNREITVCGCQMIVHFSIADHGDVKPVILTIGCKNTPFIPFAIVCKVARMFLGDDNLTLYEYTKDGSKIYSWMVMLKKGKPINDFHAVKPDKENFNGFAFYRGNTGNEKEVAFKISDTE